MLVTLKQGDDGWSFGKQTPPSGMIAGGFAVEEGRRGAQGKVKRCFDAGEADGAHQHFWLRDADVDVNAGGDDFGAVGLLDVGVVGVVGIGSVKSIAPPQRQGTSRQQGIVAQLFEILAQPDSRLD